MTAWGEFVEGFIQEWRAGWQFFFTGFMTGLMVGLVVLALFFSFFSLYHQDQPMAMYCAALAAAGMFGFVMGRRR